MRRFFQTSSRNLLAAEATAGVGHHVALSVVGTDRLSESGYLRAKIAEEKLIQGSSIPYRIVRATKFFEFMDGDRRRGGPADRLGRHPGAVRKAGATRSSGWA